MVPPPPNYGVVLVTTASRTEAETIALALIQAKLAAGISMMPVQSIYTWRDELFQKEEWQLIIKTDLNHFSSLEAQVKTMHSYEVPEIIALPMVNGYPPYLHWISEQVK